MPTLEEIKVPMDEEESFLRHVWEKLCYPYCSLLVSKLINILSNVKHSESAVLGMMGYDGMNENVIHCVDVDEKHLGNLELICNDDMEEQKCTPSIPTLM